LDQPFQAVQVLVVIREGVVIQDTSKYSVIISYDIGVVQILLYGSFCTFCEASGWFPFEKATNDLFINKGSDWCCQFHACCHAITLSFSFANDFYHFLFNIGAPRDISTQEIGMTLSGGGDLGFIGMKL
jgi:hypothetical protein